MRAPCAHKNLKDSIQPSFVIDEMIRSAYILNKQADFVWFLALPFLAIAAAFACYHWLPAVALASVTLWVTIPHHYATWVRAYGLPEDFKRWRGRLIFGPIAIFALALAAAKWAPITLIILTMLWDKQHLLMQQHGFARIYDYKAKSGAPSTSRFDLALNWILFGNLFLTSPFFTPLWLRELYRLNIPLSAATVETVHILSWTITISYSLIYLGHLAWTLNKGYAINPVKYVFLGASYFLWYFTAWQTSSALVYAIAGQLMHGIQYIIIAYVYTRRRTEQAGRRNSWTGFLVRPGNVAAFLILGVVYAAFYQVLVNQPLEVFGFGLIPMQDLYPAVPSVNIEGVTQETAYDLFAASLVSMASMTHYYLDSFIWKVSDQTTRSGL